MSAASDSPRVSVLMPTYNQHGFIRRALDGLFAQSCEDWELVIVDDGSTDATAAAVTSYSDDVRVRIIRRARNHGLGAALELATSAARGDYIAYLPSDDVYYREHLSLLVRTLDENEDVYVAYGGVRWGYSPTLQRRERAYGEAATLRGDEVVGAETEAFRDPPQTDRDAWLNNGNVLALVQVAHRRTLEAQASWPSRETIVSDTIELDFWRGLADAGATFAYAGQVTCEWTSHPEQRHRIIGGQRSAYGREEGGLSRYRAFYGVESGERLNWQPARGMRVDERARYAPLDGRRARPSAAGLRILLVGDLGWNPERILALEEDGHVLAGLWIDRPEPWDTAGPLPFGNVEEIGAGPGWERRAKRFAPDVTYALLNWHAVPLIRRVVDAALGPPVVFHFKESAGFCHAYGLWASLVHILERASAHIFISEENRAWFRHAAPHVVDDDATLILDGDLPKRDWMSSAWSPKLSSNGEIHTVCAGRWLGTLAYAELAAAGIHVHLYGPHMHDSNRMRTRAGLATGYVHLHDSVEPANWVTELSRYDAAWTHVFDSTNGGDLRRANADDLNLPARLGTYAFAGLPWIVKDNAGSAVAVESLARAHDVGLYLRDARQLAAALSDRVDLARLSENMRAARAEFAFDSHVDRLVQFFRRVIARDGASTHSPARRT